MLNFENFGGGTCPGDKGRREPFDYQETSSSPYHVVRTKVRILLISKELVCACWLNFD